MIQASIVIGTQMLTRRSVLRAGHRRAQATIAFGTVLAAQVLLVAVIRNAKVPP